MFLLLPCSLVWWCFIRQVNSLAEEWLSTSVIHYGLFHFIFCIFIVFIFTTPPMFLLYVYSITYLCFSSNIIHYVSNIFLRKIILLNDFIFTFSLIIHTIMFGCSRFIRYIDRVFQIVIVILYQYFSKHIILFALFVFC